MPELPEVETLCRQLDCVMADALILSVSICDGKLGEPEGLPGKKVLRVKRRGKEILIMLQGGLVLQIHLRMSGRLLWRKDLHEPPYKRCTITLDRGMLHFVDPRRFGTLTVYRDSGARCEIPDPLRNMKSSMLLEMATGRRLPIKSFLMDQKTMGGIGNIYACEILHRAKINPWKCAAELTRQDWERILKATESVLKKAVDSRGTTISDWTDLFGIRGTYQNHLRVYGREGKPCNRCRSILVRGVLNGRGTYYCPSCQSEDDPVTKVERITARRMKEGGNR